MNNKSKFQVKNSVGRVIFVAVAVLAQFAWIYILTLKMQKYSVAISLATSCLALLIVLSVYASSENSAFKMPWIILILVFPVTGTLLYLLVGNSHVLRTRRRQFDCISSELQTHLHQDEQVFAHLEHQDLAIANQSRYILNSGKYPIYQNTHVDYYGDTVEALQAQIEALRTAEHFIFMEYHAIEDSTAFHSLLEVLKQKAAQGVDVRILYDDIGSMGFINKDFIGRMKDVGIDCRVFNPMIPFLNVFMNNRDHRKITVVDNKIGFTGGYNLADEYFNITHPYGEWKDTGVRLEGDAVLNLTEIFLENWNAIKHTDTNYDQYLALPENSFADKGFVQPYAETPLDDEALAESIYMNIIKNAKKYVWFTTPYLITSDEMNRELIQAAKRGVDVRIITPGIPDKKVVFRITRSHYDHLLSQGVKIYEYTPGFIHAKQCLADDESAVVGTINLDWRSLYLHFENGVYLYDCDCLSDMKQDFEQTFEIASEVTCDSRPPQSLLMRIWECLLRLVSTLM